MFQAFVLYLFWGSLLNIFAFVTDFQLTYNVESEDNSFFRYTTSFSCMMCINITLWPWMIYIFLITRNTSMRNDWFTKQSTGDLGWRKNLLRVFGYNPLTWLVPTQGLYDVT
ncbi:hypothetical protein AB6A40_001771 [Gnathostoma spinigerum]|uniref:Uncharacterized protein n=1 Tax=Gnathostoma spinigerum TaxID=75299 RepID=A0ABD6EEF3_9BILA